MHIYVLSFMTLLLCNFGNHISAASTNNYDVHKKPAHPLAFTQGVIVGAVSAPLAMLSLQTVGIHPLATYCCLLAAASSAAYVAGVPYNTYRTADIKSAAEWFHVKATYQYKMPRQLLPVLSTSAQEMHDKVREDAYELLRTQSFAQGFVAGAALAPFILYLQLPYMMIHTT